MASSEARLKALELRKQGESVKIISKRVGAAKSTVSRWTNEIILSIEQLETLKKRSLDGAERGRLTANLNRKKKKKDYRQKCLLEGELHFRKITKKELLVAGLALYAGEGVKKRGEVRFCNSDPSIVAFMIKWLKECFNIDTDRLHCAVGINISHKDREKAVINYWSQVTHLPLQNFLHTSFKKVTNKKIYENFNSHFGTLDVRVLRSASLIDEINGLIHGLVSYQELFK
ncbi:hypothetical protein A2872_01625 [Candidatus Gottesmanbacteria bacterium RIFCSPHIGHO2_01_FULL_42_12]|uniref:Uncharacterized protein n=1 Tax=Candidatus Gottesmanbacteria bacterium RIFCSPHIGHO2_01_FULL_42_12 TaxID=1798377 RepID=A0A1F5Z529_9BACT|nr:MAG: hypothetical protein A2872_01625 [Candidatus Gottesmanbacteria bacterium RIFCSPHIGHO2_01_FULL_42_12]